ncbi:unnamed protein product, partial [Adineta steineri]
FDLSRQSIELMIRRMQRIF